MNQVFLFVLTVLLPIAIIICGVVPVRTKDTTQAIMWEGGIRIATMLWVLMCLLFVVPRFREIFEGFGVELPGMTVVLMKPADLSQPFSRIGLAFLEAALAGTVGLFAFLRRQEATISSANWISIAATGILVAGYLAFPASLILPLIQLLNDLS